ncbi:MAG: 16S rRNA (cytosine(1402)-N(4))-methyltransferase RsmH [Candidatus Sericytochromatia bacterium]|nr:16S rRNA (cytosine(1402)-N(4))-methyltransferase RsmH [Candidatus Sericytochromatia bacterium]
MQFLHEPVLFNEVIRLLDPCPGDVILDATVGGGGHASALLKAVGPQGKVIGFDRDPRALTAAEQRLASVGNPFELIHAPFDAMSHLPLPPVDKILFDLGVSSPQLDSAERGFSFRLKGPLDMRMDPATPQAAQDILRCAEESTLADIFHKYGEERYARRIARAIVRHRLEHPIWSTSTDFAHFLSRLIPSKPGGIHPATRVFQALRIAVNDELGMLERSLPTAVGLLRPGGRVGVISFHSLEDRIVKQFFAQEFQGCTCPPRQPICTCQRQPSLERVTQKPVVAGEEELSRNPRARSAKLRVARRLLAR